MENILGKPRRIRVKKTEEENFQIFMQNSYYAEFDHKKTAQKMKFSIKNFFGKYDQIRSFLRIWSHLLKKSAMKNFIFCAVIPYFFHGPIQIFLNIFTAVFLHF